jgi:hypothetical protein
MRATWRFIKKYILPYAWFAVAGMTILSGVSLMANMLYAIHPLAWVFYTVAMTVGTYYTTAFIVERMVLV